jgi:hypothetical protein
MRWFFGIIPIVAAIQVISAISAMGFHLDPSLDPEPLESTGEKIPH